MAQARAQEQLREGRGATAHGRVGRRLGIPAEVRRAYEDVVRAARTSTSEPSAVGKAKKWMVQASADYSIGFLDVREVSDAVEAYVTLRTG